MSYYLENTSRLQAVAISSEDTNGAFVAPSPETINEYKPLARPIFIYVDTNAVASRPEVAAFVEFYLNTAMSSDIISEVGYVPLADASYDASLGLLWAVLKRMS